MAEAGRTKKELSCDRHPDAQVIEDSRVAKMVCGECRKILGDCVPNIPENCTVIGNNDGSSSAESSHWSLNLIANIISEATNSQGTMQCARIENPNRFDEIINAVYDRIKIMAQQLGGNQEVIDFAKKILSKRLPLMMSNLNKSWLPDTFACACLFAGFFKMEIPRTFKEIESVSPTSSHVEILKCYEKITIDRTFGLSHSEIKVEGLVLRFCEKLHLPKEIIKVALHIGIQASNLETTARRLPDSIAATAIYMATKKKNYKLSMKEVADKCCLTTSTIARVYKDMKNISTDNLQT